jgi:pyridoxamine 5'-phosphate oxidase family protein
LTLTNAEIGYLRDQGLLGRLATIQPDGSPQVKPVGFRYNPELGTIDIAGFNMSKSQKYRNVARDGRVSLVVDDIASTQPWRVRFLEIRGTAEAVPPSAKDDGAKDDGDDALIRIHPARVLSFGIEEPPGEPHQTQLVTRDVA